MHHNLSRSQLYAFATVLLWSSAYVFTKTGLQYYSFSALAFLRCAVAAACFFVVLLVRKKLLLSVRQLPLLFVSGAVGFALYTLAFNKGSEALNPTTSCILISTSPIITALLAKRWLRETLGLVRWGAIGLAFCGILVMTLWDGSLRLSQGIFWMLAAALLISIYNILQRSLAGGLEPLQITAYSFFTGTILLTPFLPESVAQLLGAPVSQIWLVLFLGACPSALAYLFWAKALSLAPTTGNVSNYMFLTPFLALCLDYFVTGGVPDAATFVGGGIIMVSLAVFLWASRRG